MRGTTIAFYGGVLTGLVLCAWVLSERFGSLPDLEKHLCATHYTAFHDCAKYQ